MQPSAPTTTTTTQEKDLPLPDDNVIVITRPNGKSFIVSSRRLPLRVALARMMSAAINSR